MWMSQTLTGAVLQKQTKPLILSLYLWTASATLTQGSRILILTARIWAKHLWRQTAMCPETTALSWER